jgi:hypothetical protein
MAILAIFFPLNYGDCKPPKSCDIRILNFLLSRFGEILAIKKNGSERGPPSVSLK